MCEVIRSDFVLLFKGQPHLFLFSPEPMPKVKPQTNIFGETEEADSKIKRFYNKYDLVSYFLKAMRLGDTERSLQIFWALKLEGISEYYISKKLVQFASEDCVGSEIVQDAWTAFQIIREFKSEENTIQRLIIRLCEAEKMWESSGEHFWELRRIQLREQMKQKYKQQQKPFDMPDYVYDQYTAKGKAALRRGEQIDRRYSGVYEGSGLFMRASFLKWQTQNPETTTINHAYSDHLLKCKEERLTVDEYLQKHDITIDQFLDLGERPQAANLDTSINRES